MIFVITAINGDGCKQFSFFKNNVLNYQFHFTMIGETSSTKTALSRSNPRRRNFHRLWLYKPLY